MDEVTHTILEQPNNMGNTSTQNIVDVCSALIAYKVLHNKS